MTSISALGYSAPQANIAFGCNKSSATRFGQAELKQALNTADSVRFGNAAEIEDDHVCDGTHHHHTETPTDSGERTFKDKMKDAFRGMGKYFKKGGGFLSDVLYYGVAAGVSGVAGFLFPPLWGIMIALPIFLGTQMLIRMGAWAFHGYRHGIETAQPANES